MGEDRKNSGWDEAWYLSKFALVVMFEATMIFFGVMLAAAMFMLCRDAGYPGVGLIMGFGGLCTGFSVRIVGRAWMFTHLFDDE